ncbi:tetratricopeptide repeat protein 22-like [Glandiceps talaboti]
MAADKCPSSLPKSSADCGHFHLPLKMLEEGIDRQILAARYKSINKQLELEIGPIRYCLLNTLGVLKFCLGEKSKACTDYFMKVLEEDPCNLNALANLAYVYQSMGMTRKAEVYSKPLQAFFSGKSDLSTEERQCALVRCVAEQAYSLAFDCYDESLQSPPGYEAAYALYECAIDESQNITGLDDERYKWKFFMAINRIRVIQEDFIQKERVLLLEKVLHLLQDVLRQKEFSDRHYQAQSWLYIGRLMLRSKCLYKDAPPHFIAELDPDLKECYEDPTKCIQKAESIAEVDWKELTKFAGILLEAGSYEEGLQVVKKSLEKNSDCESNWNAYRLKASICLKIYDKQSQNTTDHDESESLLKEAKEAIDLVMTPGMKHRYAVIFLAAKVQLRLGASFIAYSTDFAKNVKDKEAIMKALELLSSIRDSSDRNIKLKLIGDCLMYLEEYSQATDKYTQCINADTPGKYYFVFFSLLVSLFHQLQQLQSADNPSQQKSEVIEEICDQFQQLLHYYAKHEKWHVQKTLQALERDFPSEFKEVNRCMQRKTGKTLREFV